MVEEEVETSTDMAITVATTMTSEAAVVVAETATDTSEEVHAKVDI